MSNLPSNDEAGPVFQFSSLLNTDRADIVSLTADFNTPGAAYADYNRFQLSPLGADVDLEGNWTMGTSALEQWRHIASTGRDQYVRVVHRGYLYPLGLRAVIINICERLLNPDPANPENWSDAVMQQFVYVKVLEPVKAYPAYGVPYTSDWPFTQIEMKTILTPSIGTKVVDTAKTYDPNGQLIRMIWNGTDFEWIFVGTDAAGRTADVTMPMCFMYAGTGSQNWPSEYDPQYMRPVAAAYNNLMANRTGSLNGDHIMYAPEGSGKPGSTTHPTSQVSMLAATTQTDPVVGLVGSGGPTISEMTGAQQPAFFPVLSQAVVRLPAAEGLSRGPFNDSTHQGVAIQYYGPFVTGGYEAGSVYMELSDYVADASKAPTLQFPADAVGGVGTPNIMVSGLSSTAGLVSGDLDFFSQHNAQDPADYFPTALLGTAASQLLGGLRLSDLISGTPQGGSWTPPTMALPSIVNELDPSGARSITYDMSVTMLPWSPSPGGTGNIFQPDGPSGPADSGTLTLNALVQISPSGQSSYTVRGVMSPFTVNIIGTSGGLNFIQIPFKRAEFTTASGKKPDIKVEVGQITFQGALTFVNTLEQFLEDLGGSGFSIKVLPTGITAGLTISLPDISIGMVDISGLSMLAAVDVPFLGAPATATFSFASKEHPFTVAVSMFGGSGFITLVLGLHEVQQVTAGINFGGNFELNLGVASGGIQLVAGIFYNYGATTGVQLTGYVKLSGGVCVLGIISVSVTLDLTLTYQENNGQSWVTGSATLTLSIHIIFFSVSFGFTITKQFSGSGSPPPAQDPAIRRAAGHAIDPFDPGYSFTDPVTPAGFADLMTVENWSDYCAVFAA